MVGPSAVERAVDPVPGGARRTLGIPGVSCGSSKKDGPLKKGKLMGDIWLGDVINMRFLNANEHRYIIDME